MAYRIRNVHNLGDLSFKSRKDLWKHVKTKFLSDDFDNNEQIWKDLAQLSLKFYDNEKEIIAVKRLLVNGRHELWYTLEDQSVIKVKIRETVLNKVYSHTEFCVHQAFIEAVLESKRLFITMKDYTCADCNGKAEYVNYSGPMFTELKYAFMHEKKHVPFALHFDKKTDSYSFLSPLDDDYREHWRRFHNHNARMVAVCGECNKKYKKLERKAGILIAVHLYNNKGVLTLTMEKLRKKYADKFS